MSLGTGEAAPIPLAGNCHLCKKRMPLIEPASYRAPLGFRNPWTQTLYPALFRKVSGVCYRRERLDLPDGDFLDLDWSETGSNRLVIVLHGLEGNARRPYVKGMVRAFNRAGWDALGFNFRNCSGTPNRLLQSYHIGATGDLAWLVERLAASARYACIALVGFSLGGNVVLKYLGEQGSRLPSVVQAAVAFSVPVDVVDANREIRKPRNRLYVWRFMQSMNAKIEQKRRRFGDQLFQPGRPARNFDEFDEWYTAPIHGFSSAHDYWTRNSSIRFLPDIRVPALLINAEDDTFLGPACYPTALARRHRYLHLEIPRHGGHVGFVRFGHRGLYGSEQRALTFVHEVLGLRKPQILVKRKGHSNKEAAGVG